MFTVWAWAVEMRWLRLCCWPGLFVDGIGSPSHPLTSHPLILQHPRSQAVKYTPFIFTSVPDSTLYPFFSSSFIAVVRSWTDNLSFSFLDKVLGMHISHRVREFLPTMATTIYCARECRDELEEPFR